MEMKIRHRYEVRWYQYNLTYPWTRRFITKIGARLFAWNLERTGTWAVIYKL